MCSCAVSAGIFTFDRGVQSCITSSSISLLTDALEYLRSRCPRVVSAKPHPLSLLIEGRGLHDNLRDRDNLSTTDSIAVPKVSAIQRFDCITFQQQRCISCIFQCLSHFDVDKDRYLLARRLLNIEGVASAHSLRIIEYYAIENARSSH